MPVKELGMNKREVFSKEARKHTIKSPLTIPAFRNHRDAWYVSVSWMYAPTGTKRCTVYRTWYKEKWKKWKGENSGVTRFVKSAVFIYMSVGVVED
jgi:hypothetical protein